jgi:O-antigen ligase
MYVEWLADTGILGLSAFLLMSLLLIRLAAGSMQAHLRNPMWPWHLALIGGLSAWYVHGLVDFFFEFTPASTAFWLLAGLAVSAWYTP